MLSHSCPLLCVWLSCFLQNAPFLNERFVFKIYLFTLHPYISTPHTSPPSIPLFPSLLTRETHFGYHSLQSGTLSPWKTRHILSYSVPIRRHS
jgi:hypothetical protein